MSVFFRATSSKQFAKSRKNTGTNLSMIQNVKKRMGVMTTS